MNLFSPLATWTRSLFLSLVWYSFQRYLFNVSCRIFLLFSSQHSSFLRLLLFTNGWKPKTDPSDWIMYLQSFLLFPLWVSKYFEFDGREQLNSRAETTADWNFQVQHSHLGTRSCYHKRNKNDKRIKHNHHTDLQIQRFLRNYSRPSQALFSRYMYGFIAY